MKMKNPSLPSSATRGSSEVEIDERNRSKCPREEGVERVGDFSGETAISKAGGAESGAVDEIPPSLTIDSTV